MKKTNIILIIAIIILSIALIVMTLLYFNATKIAKNNQDILLSAAEETFEANKRISELEEELKVYKNADIIMSTTNTTNSNNTVSTEPYIPDGMKVADPNDNSGVKASDIELNRSPENVTIEVLKDTITNTSVKILITDNNEDYYGWGVEFKVQRKVNNKWETLPYVSDDLAWNAIAYVPDENNQLKQKLNIENYYGKLEKGTYRIVKPVYDNEYIDLYSNEFEIK